jgi:hypothetical protein
VTRSNESVPFTEGREYLRQRFARASGDLIWGCNLLSYSNVWRLNHTLGKVPGMRHPKLLCRAFRRCGRLCCPHPNPDVQQPDRQSRDSTNDLNDKQGREQRSTRRYVGHDAADGPDA